MGVNLYPEDEYPDACIVRSPYMGVNPPIAMAVLA